MEQHILHGVFDVVRIDRAWARCYRMAFDQTGRNHRDGVFFKIGEVIRLGRDPFDFIVAGQHADFMAQFFFLIDFIEQSFDKAHVFFKVCQAAARVA